MVIVMMVAQRMMVMEVSSNGRRPRWSVKVMMAVVRMMVMKVSSNGCKE